MNNVSVVELAVKVPALIQEDPPVVLYSTSAGAGAVRAVDGVQERDGACSCWCRYSSRWMPDELTVSLERRRATVAVLAIGRQRSDDRLVERPRRRRCS